MGESIRVDRWLLTVGRLFTGTANGQRPTAKTLLGAIRKFTRNRPPEDDQTLVVVSFDAVRFEVRGANEEVRRAASS
jgi:hypothetical protein